MPKKKSTCIICGRRITADVYGDQTAAGEITRTYMAWGHDDLGLGDRGAEDPEPHWAHPKNGDPSGQLQTLSRGNR